MTNIREHIYMRAQLWFRLWYRIISLLDRKGMVEFMNYGFAHRERQLELHPDEEANRYSIQLYDHLAQDQNLQGKRVLEVGCGRGGGLAFLERKHGPFYGKGIDLDKMAVQFCNRKHGHERLRFFTGNAQALEEVSDSADVILNVESSHRYPKFDHFLKEVYRVLKPGGSFLYTDYRYNFQLNSFFASLERSGLIKIRENNITSQVVHALQQDDPRKRRLIRRVAPWPLNYIALDFAATIGSNTYKAFESGKWQYFSFHFQKPD